ncbi:COG4315 family predicted lipoprotein [Leifsonia sp. 2MCAF36]|uniref:COG4315 family predicted lipoprotein n=1 Tax=Leifsonia sp. 2MCAF36 TaxID=3232988 RepID=UPI003F953BA1
MRTNTARIRIAAVTAGAAAALLALAACSSGGGAGGGYSAPGGSSSPSTSASSSGASSGAILKTGSTTLGTVVVDGKGLTAYVFDKDTANSGTSVCTGACAAQWPAIEASSDHPTVTGVSGKIGTITGVDGKKQVTLDGRPLYTFAQDTSAGDVTGQGFAGIWWVVGPDGTKIMSSSSSGSSGGYTK